VLRSGSGGDRGATYRTRSLHNLKDTNLSKQLFDSTWLGILKKISSSIPPSALDEFNQVWPFPDRDAPRSVVHTPLDYYLDIPVYMLLRYVKLDFGITAYNLVDLVRFSGTLSASRASEEQTYPLLSITKLLLREAIFYQQSTLLAKLETSTEILYDRHDILQDYMSRMINIFDEHTMRRRVLEPRVWASVFCSVCIISAIKSILSDSFYMSRRSDRSWSRSDQNAMDSVYKVLVSAFVWSSSPWLDEDSTLSAPEEVTLYRNMCAAVRHANWAEFDIRTTRDFLLGLGSGYSKGGRFLGFVTQERVARQHLRPSPEQQPQDVRPLRMSNETEDRSIDGPAYSTASHQDLDTKNNEHISPGEVPTTTKPMYTRVQQDRIFCPQCNSHSDGFRGEHELRRHQDREHRATIRKWIIIEPDISLEDEYRPVLPLSKCKSCREQKKAYGAYYNAAAHLRRAHFMPRERKGAYLDKDEKRGGKGAGDWPPMSVLKHWMKEIEVPQHESPANSDNDDGLDSEFSMSTPKPARPQSTLQQAPTTFSSVNAGPGFPTTSTLHPLQASPAQFNRSAVEASYPLNESGRRERCPYPECGKVFKDLAAHLLTHQNERPEKCPIVTCDYHIKGFARKYDKNRHALTHYRGTMICPFCPGSGTPAEKTFTRADVFKRHLTGVHGVEQTAPNSRNKPEPTQTSTSSGQGGKCSICKISFESAQLYYDHLDECVLGVIAPETHPSKDTNLPAAESSTGKS
jgi:hypothetical protein